MVMGSTEVAVMARRQESSSNGGQSASSPEDCDQQKLLPGGWMARPPIVLQRSQNQMSFKSSRSRFRAGPTRKLRRRAVLKSGECNVLQSRISRRSLRFLQDIFTTLVDTQWRWTLLCFALSFLLSWMMFAGVWWLIAFTHGDFDPKHMDSDSWKPCVSDLHGFTSCFLFSIETQHTIGYGGRSTTEECPEAIFVMCIQSISGVMIQAFMVGIVFAKMSRPKQRTQTLLFSKQAVICQRDGELCLMFRVGDMRKSHIIGATVRAQLIRSRTTKEGEILPHNQQELVVGADGQEENLFFIWPCTVVHRMEASSPFYNMSAEDMLTERFEIVVILEGTIESTGQTTQARSSYLPSEILWGHRFEPLVSYSKDRQGYEVDYSLFNSTVQVDTPLCSGRELAEFYRLQDELRHQTSPGFIVDEDQLQPVPDPVPQRVYQPLRPQYLQVSTINNNNNNNNHHRHHHHHHQNQRHRSELSLVDVKYTATRSGGSSSNQCCSDCSAPPPPYGRAADESIPNTTAVAKYPLSDSLCCDRGVRSCQELLQPRQQLQQHYLLPEHASSNGSLPLGASSFPALPRRHTGSKESLRRGSSRERKKSKEATITKEQLQEIVVHRLEQEVAAVAMKRKRRSYEHALLVDVNGRVASSGGSAAGPSSSSTSSSSGSTSGSENEAKQLKFTSV